MPYTIKEHDGQYCIYKRGEETPIGCHATRSEAEAQVRAILVSESERQAAEIRGRPSLDDLRQMVHRAVFGDSYTGPGWVVELTETDAIVWDGAKHWLYPYNVDDSRTVTLGTPSEAILSWQTRTARATAEGVLAVEPRRAFVTDLRGVTCSEDGRVEIEVCRDGSWDHPTYGRISITPEVRESFVRNFAANVRRVGELPLDYDHEAGPASGWITGLRNEGTRLIASVRLTDAARQKIQAQEYRFFSPEWSPDWTDPETGRRYGPTLLGGALTNRPFFRGMQAIACSEMQTQRGGGTMTQQVAGTVSLEKGQQATDQERLLAQLAAAEEARRASEERLTAVEAELAARRAAEERRLMTDQLAALRFGEGRLALAPASRSALVDALMGAPAEIRDRIREALGSVQFVEHGERGFAGTADQGQATLTASERQHVEAIARRLGVSVDEALRKYMETKAARLRAMEHA